MRLTAELISNSLSYLNPLKERELDLRGHKIPAIENLGAARDQECIDFTDNDISVLTNFPQSPRLQTLLCARNRIQRIEKNVTKSVPALSTLVLTQNSVSELADLEVLRGFEKLTFLSLVDNPVANKENYRYWILFLVPQIRFLDYQKVKDTERVKAREIFGTLKAPTEAANGILAASANASTSYIAPLANGASKQPKVKLNEKEKARYEALIKNAKTLAEITRLEKEMSEGRTPAGVLDEDVMDET